MKTGLDEHYDASFYSKLGEGMSRSAEKILGFVFQFHKPESVIDIGCGRGAWLAAAESLGSRRLRGVDGDWIRQEDLFSENIEFGPADLAAGFEITETFDLCISVEVAEHLPESAAKNFVGQLCAASDLVLFSAAIELQGGVNHVNERRQSYWIELFESNGYEVFDAIRPAFWDDAEVEWWYRQNCFLFANPASDRLDLDLLRAAVRPMADIVHPDHYELKIRDYEKRIEAPSLRFCLKVIGRYLSKKIGRSRG